MHTERELTDDEVSFAIRYLDPDLTDPPLWRRISQRNPAYWARVSAAALLIALCCYFTLLKWVPALLRLTN